MLDLDALYNQTVIPKKWYQKKWGIALLIILFLVLSVGGSVIFYALKEGQKLSSQWQIQDQEKQWQDFLDTVVGNNYNLSNSYLGTSTPKITIVEFADFACPFCQKDYPIVRRLAYTYGDNIRIIYRDFPGHENSVELALTARCAGEQKKFWEMHDELFLKQAYLNSAKITDSQIIEMATNVGLDVARFEKCYNGKKFMSYIQQDYADIQKLYLTIDPDKNYPNGATPTWFINGYPKIGEISEPDLINIIESLLNENEQTTTTTK